MRAHTDTKGGQTKALFLATGQQQSPANKGLILECFSRPQPTGRYSLLFARPFAKLHIAGFKRQPRRRKGAFARLCSPSLGPNKARQPATGRQRSPAARRAAVVDLDASTSTLACRPLWAPHTQTGAGQTNARQSGPRILPNDKEVALGGRKIWLPRLGFRRQTGKKWHELARTGTSEPAKCGRAQLVIETGRLQ